MAVSTKTPERILILEMSAKGHHPSYLKWILESGIAEFAELVVAAPLPVLRLPEVANAASRPETLEISVGARESARLNDFSTLGLARRELTVRRLYGEAFRRASRRGKVGLVILPFIDECLNAFAVLGAPFGTTPWIGINMRMQFHLSKMGVIAPEPKGQRIREWLFRRLLKPRQTARILTIDPTLAEFAQKQSWKGSRKVQYLPDPSMTFALTPRSKARAELDIPADAVTLLCYGAISVRKGVLPLMNAMSRDECPRNIHLILAGSHEDDIKEFLSGPIGVQLQNEKRLHIFPGYVPDEKVPILLSASDAMWVGYIDFYTMSSVLVLAARHKLLPIVSRQGVCGYLIRQRPCGLSVDPTSIDSVAAVLQRISRWEEDVQALAEAGPRYYELHTLGVFNNILRDASSEAIAL